MASRTTTSSQLSGTDFYFTRCNQWLSNLVAWMGWHRQSTWPRPAPSKDHWLQSSVNGWGISTNSKLVQSEGRFLWHYQEFFSCLICQSGFSQKSCTTNNEVPQGLITVAWSDIFVRAGLSTTFFWRWRWGKSGRSGWVKEKEHMAWGEQGQLDSAFVSVTGVPVGPSLAKPAAPLPWRPLRRVAPSQQTHLHTWPGFGEGKGGAEGRLRCRPAAASPTNMLSQGRCPGLIYIYLPKVPLATGWLWGAQGRERKRKKKKKKKPSNLMTPSRPESWNAWKYPWSFQLWGTINSLCLSQFEIGFLTPAPAKGQFDSGLRVRSSWSVSGVLKSSLKLH